MLMLEYDVMHLPVLPLRSRRHGRFSRVLCVWVNLSEREVAKDESQPLAELPLCGFHDRVGHSAVWALVVAVFDERDRRIVGTSGVVVLADGRGERAHGRASGAGIREARPAVSRRGSASSALKMPSAPGFVSGGER